MTLLNDTSHVVPLAGFLESVVADLKLVIVADYVFYPHLGSIDFAQMIDHTVLIKAQMKAHCLVDRAVFDNTFMANITYVILSITVNRDRSVVLGRLAKLVAIDCLVAFVEHFGLDYGVEVDGLSVY